MKDEFLAFHINMPQELIPLYDFLQSELNFFLSDEESRSKIQQVDYNLHKGNVWRSFRDAFKLRIQTWKIKNKTWYSYMLFENIRREVQSKEENIVIYQELLNNDSKINEDLFNVLISKHKIYATRGRISNIKQSRLCPELPTSSVFEMDYSVSAEQNFKKDKNNLCQIQLEDGTWLEYQIYLPASLNWNLTGIVAKPRFYKKDGRYMGMCSYKYTPMSVEGDSILGVDIGQIKKFSAVALHKSGKYSKEYVQSTLISKLDSKLKKLYTQKDYLYKKISNFQHFRIKSAKNDRRVAEYREISSKIMNLKKQVSKLVAKEVMIAAKSEKCNVVHIENLAWLSSKGGKWNHSQIHKDIEEAGVKNGVKVEKVNARNTSKEHPITKEIGTVEGRNVVFKDGKKIDRDVLGAINLATRNKRKKKPNKIIKLKKSEPTAKRVKPDKSKRREIRERFKKTKGDMQIVVFSPHKLINNSVDGMWSLIDKVQPKSSLLPPFKNKLVPINYNF